MQEDKIILCLVTSVDRPLNQYLDWLAEAIRGGVTMIQYRDKSCDSHKHIQEIKALHKLAKMYSIPLLVNDHVELATHLNVDGVHLGQTDMHPDLARQKLGADKIIGLSIESETEFLASQSLTTIDYISASAVFHTPSKSDIKKAWGIDGLKYICSHSKHKVIAIGGINEGNILEVVNAGVHGVAIVSELHKAENATEKAQKLRRAFC